MYDSTKLPVTIENVNVNDSSKLQITVEKISNLT